MYEKWNDKKDRTNDKMYISAARMAIDNAYNVAPFPADFVFPNVIKD